jgi:hypothetical protein
VFGLTKSVGCREFFFRSLFSRHLATVSLLGLINSSAKVNNFVFFEVISDVPYDSAGLAVSSSEFL